MTTPRTILLRPIQKRFQRWWEVTHPEDAFAASVGNERAKTKCDELWAAWRAAERSGFRLGVEEAHDKLQRDYDDRSLHEEVERLAEEVRGRALFSYKSWEKVEEAG